MKDFSRQASSGLGALLDQDLKEYLGASIHEVRTSLVDMAPQERLGWSLERFSPGFVLTTSFGIQSSVLLHMLSLLKGGLEVPVIWVDTGYLPPETYHYADILTKQLGLNIKPVQSDISASRMEALYGCLWESGSIADLEKYHLIRKVKPLEEALDDHKHNASN